MLDSNLLPDEKRCLVQKRSRYMKHDAIKRFRFPRRRDADFFLHHLCDISSERRHVFPLLSSPTFPFPVFTKDATRLLQEQV